LTLALHSDRFFGKFSVEVISMVKSGLACLAVTVALLLTLAAQDQPSPAKSHQVILKYLGTAGWEITDETSVILIDPYLSRINGPAPPG